MGIFAVNGFEPDVRITTLQRTAAVLDGSNAGRVMDGSMVRDIIGTCYNYSLVCQPKLSALSDYDTLYDAITDPADSLSLTVPYGQGLTTFDAYITNTSDSNIRMGGDNYFKKLTFNAIAIDPQRTSDSGTASGTRSNAPFTVDGVGYHMIVHSLSRSSSVLDGDEAGRVLSGHMERDVIGTYYNYSATITAMTGYAAEYDSFYDVITAPVDSHSMTLPFGQGSITFDAYVANASDKLIRYKDGFYFWGNLTLNFVAMKPYKTP